MRCGAFFWMVCSMHTIVYTYVRAILSPVKSKKHTPTTQQLFWNKLQACWPALKGSLAQVRKPCIRPNCQACASGTKHPNYLLAFTQKGRRRCLYVPLAMVPKLKRALANGRRIEQMLYQMGPALLKEYRAHKLAQTGPAVPLKGSPAKKTSPKS